VIHTKNITHYIYQTEPDLRHRALGLDADLVVVPAEARRGLDLDRLAKDGQFPIAVVDAGDADLSPGGTAPVLVVSGGDAAAVEAGVRIAHQQGRVVELDERGRRRGRQPTAERLLAAGIRVTEVGTDDAADDRLRAGAIVVLGRGSTKDGVEPLPPAGAGAVVRVLPLADDDGRTLDRLLERYSEAATDARDVRGTDVEDPPSG
jgi:hypothetical protein